MYIADVEFYRGPVGSLCEPEVQICAVFARFEEEDVVAGVEVGERIECGVIVVAGFCVEFCVFEGVWQEGV